MFDTSYPDTIEGDDGASYAVSVVRDMHSGAPWDEEDGHGPVTGWETRAKLPGEMVLCSDRHAKRFYDFAEACRIARRDGWDAEPYCTDGTETPRAKAAKAALADFNRLRRWCSEDWYYVGVIVSPLCSCCGTPDEGRSASLWGIESDCGDYLKEVARNLISEVAPC